LSFIGIEALLYVIIVKGGALSKVMDMLLFFVAVGIVYAAVHLFSWLVLQKTADQINMDLKQLQKKRETNKNNIITLRFYVGCSIIIISDNYILVLEKKRW